MSNKKVRGKNKVQKKSKLCKKEVCVDNMGKSALKSHMSTVKHSQLGDECTEAINNL